MKGGGGNNIKRQKVNQIMVAIGLFILSAIALVFTFGLALLPAGGGMAVSPLLGTFKVNSPSLGSPIADVFLWILLPIPAVVTFEGGIWRLREGLEMRKKALEYKPKTIWARFATLNQFLSIFSTIFFMFLLILLFLLLVHLFLSSPKEISIRIVLYIGSLAAYLPARKLLGKTWKGTVKKFRKGMPTYKLTKDGVSIKLFTMWNKKHPEPPPIFIRFNEIDDMQVLTYTEAEAFLKYNIGPDFQLSMRQIKDNAAYIKGQIPRPSVYTFGGAKTDCVLIRGPEIFYMIAFDTDDVSDLIEAYNSFKASAG